MTSVCSEVDSDEDSDEDDDWDDDDDDSGTKEEGVPLDDSICPPGQYHCDIVKRFPLTLQDLRSANPTTEDRY